MLAHIPRLPFGLDPLIREAKRRMRRRRFLLAGVLIVVVAGGIGVALALRSSSGGSGPGGPPGVAAGVVSFEHRSAVQAMASVFARPSAGPVPASIVRAAASLAKGAPAGTPDLPRGVLVHQGRLLLSDLGPKRHAIYVFPTRNREVCVVISGPGPARVKNGLGEGCMKAFLLGQPAAVEGGVMYYPPERGPAAQLAGLAEDGVTGIKVVLNSSPREALFRNDAWYYRFPNNHTPATAASKLLVSLADGQTTTVPLRLAAPK